MTVVTFARRHRPPARAGLPFEPWEDRHLQHLVRSNLTQREINFAVQIFAEDEGRAIAEVCARCDFLLGPAAVAVGALNATERALYALVGRAAEDHAAPGGFVLDGRPADWRDVARAANVVLAHLGRAPIKIPGETP